MLQDSYGRQFRYLRLSITDICNFRCQYCLPDGNPPGQETSFLGLDEVSTLLKAFTHLGTQKVRITGGEPSLRKDLPEIIERCSEYVNNLAMTTNGFKLAKDAATWQQAGLSQVNVSIDSLDARDFALITGQNKLSAILAGIEKALILGLKVKINVVLMKDFGLKAFQHFLQWIDDKPVTVRFIELMETGDNKDFFRKQHMSAVGLQNQLFAQGWVPMARASDAGPAQEYQHADFIGKMGLIRPYGKDFCSNCNRLRVSALGKLHLCLFAEQGYDLRPWLENADPEGLTQELQRLIVKKDVSHWLHQGETGATQQLAMLGG